MESKRLDAICDFLDVADKFIDIGTDHGYVPIKMARKGATHLLATDIHSNALKVAQKNIQNEGLNKAISTLKTDGLNGMDTSSYNTLVLAGMGAQTIMQILYNQEKIQNIRKIILQSNNHLEDLRIFMNQNSWNLKKEKVVYEKEHYYIIMLYEKGVQKMSQEEFFLGIYQKENIEYYHFLEKKYQEIYCKIPEAQAVKKQKTFQKLEWIKDYLQKENGSI